MESSSHKSTPKRKQTPRKPPARHGTKRAVKKGTTPESKSPTKRRRAAIKRAVEVLAALGDAQSNDGQGSAEESSYEDISEEDNSSESTKSSHRKSARKRKGSTKSTEESPTKKPRVEGKFVSLSSSYMSKISKSFGALDKRLFDCGYGGGARSEALQVVCNKVKDFIDAEKAVLVNIGMFSDKWEWQIKNHYRDISIPRQSDGYSCAYYTCWYAFKLISEGAVGIWADNIESIAKQIFISLIESGLVMLNAFSKKVTRT